MGIHPRQSMSCSLSQAADGPIVDGNEELDEFTVRRLSVAIARRAGYSPPTNGYLEVGLLNSIHAYLTGEFAEKPKFVGKPQGKSLQDYRRDVAVAADLSGYPTAEGKGRRFRRDELATILQAMLESGDQRSWVQP